ncbi:hypothetical protein DFA_00183 [Cavenderia fasciculata]|uniref:Uncharacterized protein n=1 Tax=Cavenderia fasciculata TaxID=261658 RepID=F4PXU5_CACFS|nr:uncharacterized protein DFA_00183 [Cavenderia fasciculata]EGG19605.1 hypothetical protein DFA_00183 [Cavenderia fasciculata]|eukprot:XP_004357899.1 hypothetical protein DFA_00183 [Cavenderia fasciculata]
MDNNNNNNESQVEEEKQKQRQLDLQQLFKQQQQQQRQQRQPIKIDQVICKRVWNNVVIRRLIYSKIRECVPISEENRVKLKSHFALAMQQYKTDPHRFVQLEGNRRFYQCPVITVDLFKVHYQYFHKYGAALESGYDVIDLVSGNPRNMVDTWFFRKVCEFLKGNNKGKDKDMIIPKSPFYTWDNIMVSNNVELYNYAKTVMPMPDTKGLKQMLYVVTSPPRAIPHYSSYGTITRPSGTKLLKALLQDLRLIDPQETQWLEWCDYGQLAAKGLTDIMETIHKYAGDYYVPTYNVFMVQAIQNKQIESIRFLYKVNKMPIGQRSMYEAAHTCDLPFLIALHNIEPEAGRLYTLFLHVMSSSFSHGPMRFSPHQTHWQTFQQEFYQLGKQLNYIDTNLQHQIDTKQPFKYQPKTIQQHFKIFQQSNVDDSSIPTLSFSSFDD